jgi:hypothetical protein
MTITPARIAARQARHDARMARAAETVPHGHYCYSRVPDPEADASRRAAGEPFVPGRYVPCPYMKVRADHPEMRNAYCRLLKRGDRTGNRRNTILLWDGVKECGVNRGFDEEESE